MSHTMPGEPFILNRHCITWDSCTRSDIVVWCAGGATALGTHEPKGERGCTGAEASKKDENIGEGTGPLHPFEPGPMTYMYVR